MNFFMYESLNNVYCSKWHKQHQAVYTYFSNFFYHSILFWHLVMLRGVSLLCSISVLLFHSLFDGNLAPGFLQSLSMKLWTLVFGFLCACPRVSQVYFYKWNCWVREYVHCHLYQSTKEFSKALINLYKYTLQQKCAIYPIVSWLCQYLVSSDLHFVK